MKRVKLAALSALFIILFLGFSPSHLGRFLHNLGDSFGATEASAEKVERPVPVTGSMESLFVELSKRLVPSVVNIYTTQTIANPYGAGPQAEMYRRFFENFFGEEMPPSLPQSRKATSLGTGFVIDEKEGLILTNYHVIADADEVKVILTEQESDQEGIDAKIVGGDAEADVALLKIKTKRKLQAVTLGDSDSLQVGDWVMAVGNPFGHGHTVTHGIISAKERIIPLSQFANYLQTDAPINPGNSGGPLINVAGQVVGINTAINAAAQSIGFAIPINYVKKILPELRSKGAVTRGFIGVNITEITPPLAKYLKLKEGVKGVIVSEVFENEPAAKAGIQAYDVITEINGKKIADGRALINTVSSFSPGEKIDVRVLRGSEQKDLKVKVGKRPNRDSLLAKRPEAKGRAKPKINTGLLVEELDNDARRELGIPPNLNGVVVSRVAPGSAADEAGLRRGDVIVEVDQKHTPNVHAFNSVFKEEKVYMVRFRRADGFSITSLDMTKAAQKSREESPPSPPPPMEGDQE